MVDNENNLVGPLILQKFVKRKVHEHIMFGFVRGIVMNFPSVSQSDAVRSFCKSFNIDDDDKTVATYLKTYLRMVHELIEMERSE